MTDIRVDTGAVTAPAIIESGALRQSGRSRESVQDRLGTAFAAHEQSELMLAAKVRILVIVPVLLWLSFTSALVGAAYWWQVMSAGIFVPTSIAHYFLAKHAGPRHASIYGLFALEIALLGFILAYPNPFTDWSIAMPQMLTLTPFFYFFVFLIHAGFSSNWRLVVWAGCWIAVTRVAQVANAAAQPGAFTDFGGSITTVDQWRDALNDPNFIVLFGHVGEIVGTLALTMAVAFLVLRSRRLVRRQVDAERARAQIARYVSPTVVDEVMARGDALTAPRSIEAAVLFADVVGSTRLAEQLGPDATIIILRDLHARLSDAVFDHSGAIDKFLGDGIMATFGATGRDRPAASDALAAALSMTRAVDAWNAERAERGEQPVMIGIGVDFGPVVAGDVGDERRLEFTVIGDVVNVASRVEQLTRALDAKLLATDRVVAAARKDESGRALIAPLEHMAAHPVRGRNEPVLLWGIPRRIPAADADAGPRSAAG